MYKYNMWLVFAVFATIFCCWITAASADEQSSDNKKNGSKDDDVKLSDKRAGKYFNYLRLPEGKCSNCSTYKCTSHKANMGGSEWCIMLFSDAITYCDSDPNCGGYSMSTAEWFHKKYDKNQQVAVHLSKAGQEPIDCPLSEWSSYEKQKTTRNTPVVYGRSTCDNSDGNVCDKSQNFNYVFVSNSNTARSDAPYLCKNHPNSLDNADIHCILPVADGVALCNSDDQCEGFMINTDDNWQKKFSKNGMQSVQLFSKGATYTPNQTWRSFKKQY